MALREIGAVLLALVAIFAVGQLWFHLVEAVLERIKNLFRGRKDPPTWHPLPPEGEDRGGS